MQTKAVAPRSCFWELTRRCELRCRHCRIQDSEENAAVLGLDQAMEIARQLGELKTKRVILTGGEPILYRGWEKVARRLADGGVKVRLFISGFGFDRTVLAMAQAARVSEFAVSLDGPQGMHDFLRPAKKRRSPSAFAAAQGAVELIQAAQLPLRVVTQVNQINADYLEEIYRLLLAWQVKQWQLHLCQMTGRAKNERDRLMCEPADLEKIIHVLLKAAREKKLLAPLHCTIGYMTEEEPVLRGREKRGRPVWLGCQAGRTTFAITPAGGVKGCVTLPDEFITASVREKALPQIWRDDQLFPYSRGWSKNLLAGRCKACALADTCRAGCPAVAYSATGTIGANPYCLRLVRRDRSG